MKQDNSTNQAGEVFAEAGKSKLNRRELMRRATALFAGITAAATSTLTGLVPSRSLAQTRASGRLDEPLSIAEQGHFWIGAGRKSTARGTTPTGEQMYVWYQIPAIVRKPYPVVLVHGGGGQGTDYLGTPFGAPGWATYLLQEGYVVYVVDRPGLGRAPFYEELLGEMDSPSTYESVTSTFTDMSSVENPHPYAHLHTQWAGSGKVDDPFVAQFMAGTGASMQNREQANRVWRARGSELLDRIGPAIMITHSAGGPFGWLTADARPGTVKALVAIETIGPVASGSNGPVALPLKYDPPPASISSIDFVEHTPTSGDSTPYLLQAGTPRRLTNLAKVPMLAVVAEASHFRTITPGTVAYLKQAGCNIELMNLWEHGVRGNGHFMMLERNNRDALQPILDWLTATIA